MLSRVYFRWTKVRYQQLIATVNVQRQETVVVIVTMNETPLLVAMYFVIGGIEIKD